MRISLIFHHTISRMVYLAVQAAIVIDSRQNSFLIPLTIEALSVQTDKDHIVIRINVLRAGIERCH